MPRSNRRRRVTHALGTSIAPNSRFIVGQNIMARHKSIERPPVARSVQIEVDGTRYEGTYSVNGPAVILDTLLLGSRRAGLMDDSPEIVAKRLLLELVHLSVRRTGS
jgi:hypothetical protein